MIRKKSESVGECFEEWQGEQAKREERRVPKQVRRAAVKESLV